MVTTAHASGICGAAARIAVPPKLCPISILGAANLSRRKATAAITSATFEVKLVAAKSPPLFPRPAKSKRSTAILRSASSRPMCAGARNVYEFPVRQGGRRSPSDESDRDFDIAAYRLGIRARLMRGIHQRLSHFAIDTRQADVESSFEEIAIIGETKIDLRVDRKIRGECDLQFSRGKSHGSFE